MYTKLPKAKIRQIFQTKYSKQPPKPKRAAAAVFKFFRDAQVLAYASCLFSFFSRALPCA